MSEVDLMKKQICALYNIVMEMSEIIAKSLPGDLPHNLQSLAEAQHKVFDDLERMHSSREKANE